MSNGSRRQLQIFRANKVKSGKKLFPRQSELTSVSSTSGRLPSGAGAENVRISDDSIEARHHLQLDLSVWQTDRVNSLTQALCALNRCLLIRRVLIFDSRVERGIPSFSAAPPGPAILPLHSTSAVSMSSFSRLASRRTSPL